MWKDRIIGFISKNKGIVIGGLAGLLIFVFGLSKLVSFIFFVILGMIIGRLIDKNKDEIKEAIKDFIDKF